MNEKQLHALCVGKLRHVIGHTSIANSVEFGIFKHSCEDLHKLIKMKHSFCQNYFIQNDCEDRKFTRKQYEEQILTKSLAGKNPEIF